MPRREQLMCKRTDQPAQCEKHSKKEQAVEKLRNGAKFDDVAREFSEDKARQGMLLLATLYSLYPWRKNSVLIM